MTPLEHSPPGDLCGILSRRTWLEQLYSSAVTGERTGITSLLAHLCEAGKIQGTFLLKNLGKSPLEISPSPVLTHFVGPYNAAVGLGLNWVRWIPLLP